jgi:uncharacterized protein (TIGR03083 family)
VVRSGTATGVDYVTTYAAAAGRFADGVAESDLQAPVPACPGWTVRDLVVHLGNTHAWAATIVETGAYARTQSDDPGSHKPRVVSEWYAAKAEDLYRVLRATAPDRPAWNFAFGDGDAGFWRRRQLHETTIHAVDLAQAAGRIERVTPAVATDGVDEVLRVMLKRMHDRGRPAALTAPLTLQCDDTGRAWTLTPRPSGAPPESPVPAQSRSAEEPPAGSAPPLVVDRRHPQADQVSGPASALYLALWHRAPYDGLDRSGDVARIDAFLSSRLVP